MSAWPHPIKAVVFDNDGVLVDTVSLYIQVNSEIIGKPYPDYMRARTNGRTDIDACKIIIDEFHLNMTPEELVAKRFKMLHDLFPQVKKIPGVMRIITTLKEKGLKMAVATSSKKEGFEPKTINHRDLYDNFECVVCGDEVTKAKPSPEIFLTAAKKICDYPPENVLVFEDAAAGIRAANDAGMASVFLWTSEKDPSENLATYNAKPTMMIHSFDEFDFDKFTWA